jgi:hypothetical protein
MNKKGSGAVEMNSAAFFAGEMDTHHFGDDAAVPRCMQAVDRDRS